MQPIKTKPSKRTPTLNEIITLHELLYLSNNLLNLLQIHSIIDYVVEKEDMQNSKF